MQTRSGNTAPSSNLCGRKLSMTVSWKSKSCSTRSSTKLTQSLERYLCTICLLKRLTRLRVKFTTLRPKITLLKTPTRRKDTNLTWSAAIAKAKVVKSGESSEWTQDTTQTAKRYCPKLVYPGRDKPPWKILEEADWVIIFRRKGYPLGCSRKKNSKAWSALKRARSKITSRARITFSKTREKTLSSALTSSWTCLSRQTRIAVAHSCSITQAKTRTQWWSKTAAVDLTSGFAHGRHSMLQVWSNLRMKTVKCSTSQCKTSTQKTIKNPSNWLLTIHQGSFLSDRLSVAISAEGQWLRDNRL